MAFWKVAGFAQPSPIEQILDKETFTLEELLDEDDLIQECKSLNGRLINYLREKETVARLLRYLVSPPTDSDDPKQQYKYPFTSCEVFCCEVDAIFNTLMEDEQLLGLLFSLLDQPAPLSCKTAGYFGRVVGQLLLKKTNEMMQYLSNNDSILERFIQQIDTTSIADVLKRLVGADDQAAMVFLPMHTQWLAETQLVDWLLDRLRASYATDVQSNAADILTAIAHTQPSPLSMQLMQQKSIAALFERALEPGSRVLVAALNVCGALLEPLRSQMDQQGDPGAAGMSPTSAGAAAAVKARSGAVSVMLEFVPQLVKLLQGAGAVATQETPYGVLTPPLGQARLKAVELLAALLRVGEVAADEALISSKALVAVQVLFVAYPFNNLLHHQMLQLLEAALQRSSPPMLEYLVGEEASITRWLREAPKQVTPTPLPGGSGKGPLDAGYLGHINRIANRLVEVAGARPEFAQRLQADAQWQTWLVEEVQVRNQLQDVNSWDCGRPAATDLNPLDSDDAEYQGDMDLDQMQGGQPTLYHRYGVLDDMDDDEEEEGTNRGGDADFNSGYNNMLVDSNMLVTAMANMGLNDSLDDNSGGSSSIMLGSEEGKRQDMPSLSNWSLLAHPGSSSNAVDIPGAGMEDDAVVLASSDDEGSPTRPFASSNNSLLPMPSRGQEGSTEPAGSSSEAASSASTVVRTAHGGAGSPPGDDMVLVEEEDALLSSSPGVEVAGPMPVVAMEGQEGLEAASEGGGAVASSSVAGASAEASAEATSTAGSAETADAADRVAAGPAGVADALEAGSSAAAGRQQLPAGAGAADIRSHAITEDQPVDVAAG